MDIDTIEFPKEIVLKIIYNSDGGLVNEYALCIKKYINADLKKQCFYVIIVEFLLQNVI